MTTAKHSASDAIDPGILGRVQAVLAELASSRSMEVIYANPVLLAPRWHELLRAAKPGRDMLVLIDMLESTAEQLKKQPWPLGAGPLDSLFASIIKGELDKAQALALAGGPDLFWRLSPVYVRRMSRAAESWAREGKWQDGVLLGQLVLAALDAREPVLAIDQADMKLAATVHWLDVVTRAVCDVPDGRLFRDAVARGERLADVVVDAGGFYLPASILHGLGILHLDPYVGGRSSSNYEGQMAVWRARFRLALDAENLFWDEASMSVPAPAEALPKAAAYLQAAAAHRSGEDRAWTLKALVQALAWMWQVGLTPPAGELERVAREALLLLNKPEQHGVRMEIDNLLDWNARRLNTSAARQSAAPRAEVDQLLATPLDEWLATMKPQDVLARYIQTARAIEDHSPQAAFSLWTAVQPLGWHQGEELRLQFFQTGVDLLGKAFAPLPALEGANALEAAVARIAVECRSDGFQRFARMLALTVHAMPRNEEEAAIRILDIAVAEDAGYAGEYAEFVALLRAILLQGAAVNRYTAQDLDEAARLYMAGARAFVACDFPGRAFHVVEHVMDLVERGSDRAVVHFIAGIGEIATPLEQQVPGAAEKLQVHFRKLLAQIVRTGTVKPILLVLFAERAKGHALAQALVNGAPLEWLESDEAKEMESRLAALGQEAGKPGGRDPDAEFGYEYALCAYATPLAQAGGSTAAERLRNLRIAFEVAASRAQSTQGRQPEWIPTDTAVQAALGPRSALLALYVGHMPDGDMAVFLMLVSDDGFDLVIGRAPGFATNLMTMEHGGLRLAMMPMAPWVSSLREAVQDDPYTRHVSARAAALLEDAQGMLLGGQLKDKLQALRAAGKDHLFIWPHGPLHFLPFHLFGPEATPLAQEWNVTYLANLHLLGPSRCHQAPIYDFAAVGLDFPAGNARGLDALSGAEDEAREIAKAMGSASHCIVGPAVNKAAVLQALRTHKRLHIASHGELPVSSAAFQSIALGTRADSDVLYAYEILRLDLKGVDLVTLSACETSLGRVDVGDNLRGFPANLLIAGVSTIIGTLWAVETQCARFFFGRFYTAIYGGRSKGDAFRTAQVETRECYPAHRDWGAFYLSGAVR